MFMISYDTQCYRHFLLPRFICLLVCINTSYGRIVSQFSLDIRHHRAGVIYKRVGSFMPLLRVSFRELYCVMFYLFFLERIFC